jgi:hypothetical protein
MPPAYCYAALQLLHGNIYESSVIYLALINSWLRRHPPMMERQTFPF